MKQKILSLIIIAIFGFAAKAQTIVESGDGWSLDSDGLLTVTKNIESVSYTGQPWSSNKSSVKSVVITEGVTSIGKREFYGHSNLKSVTFSNTVEKIGEDSFYGCSSIENITLPSSLTSIGYQSFYNCSGLTSIDIPNSVTSIGTHAFRGCSGLTSVTLPNSIKTIGSNLLSGCKNLTNIVIPEGVTEIGLGAFSSCSSLTSVTIPSSVKTFDKSVFSGCSKLESVIIPDGVKSIGASMFNGCSGLKSITLPSTITSIGAQAFLGCSSLVGTIDIPDGVESIGNDAFSGCSSLSEIILPNSIKTIGNNVFRDCASITSFVIPNSLEKMGNYLFDGCVGLESITIQEGFTSISSNAFKKCSGLTSVTIPESVESIDVDAFYGCSSLTSVTIPESVESINVSAFYGCSSLTCIEIPSGVTSIGNSAFYECSDLKYVFLYQKKSVVEKLTDKFPSKVERFFVPDDLLDGYREKYTGTVFADKFTGFSFITKQNVAGDEEEVIALSLEKGSYGFIVWAVNSGEKIRKGEEISVALTEDFDMDADNASWQTLGTAEHPFKGIFEGNYLSVKGNHRANATQPKSIFGYIGEGAEIRNVVFSGFIIDATSGGVTDGGTTYHGLVARENKGLIHNSIFEGRMEIDADAENADNAQACLVIDNEEGELDHVVGYFEGLDGEVTGNKASIIVIQNMGHGRTRGSSKKTASNGKARSKGNSTLSAEVPDDINLNYRLFTDEEFAGAEPAYWLNFDGEGYSGTFNGEWTQGTKHPVLAKGEHGATVGVKYNVVNRDESVLGPSPVFFATSKSSLEVEYSEKPLSIEVNGMEINASQIGDMKAKFSLASVNTDKGNVNVVLKYEKQSTPTAVDDIDAVGSQKTIKTVENGRVVIIRDGKKYDLAGRVLSDKF